MAFLTWTFLAFLLVTAVLYYILPKKCQWIVLLVASCVFYVWGGLRSVLFLVFSIAVTYSAGLLLERLGRQKKEIPSTEKEQHLRMKRRRKAVVAAAVVLNFSMLFILKYLQDSEGLFARFGLTSFGFALPLGLSFFVFQSTGYVVDQYREKYPAERNPLRYALFVSFFPQMVQGPIGRFDVLGADLARPHPFSAENVRFGVERFLWGCFKKMVIADRTAVAVSAFFSNSDSYSGSITALAVLLYCIDLYCDFSGGIDMAVGAAGLFGIRLDENFRRPIFARSLAEYWRRWHITLGSWMRDYVFYPLSLSPLFGRIGRWGRKHLGGRAGKILHTSAATFVVYIFIGLWHGASFRFIAYGLFNGLVISTSLLLADVFRKGRDKLHIREESAGWKVFQVLRTSLIVFVGRYLTRSPRLLVAFELIGRTLTEFHVADLFSGVPLSLGLSGTDYLIIGLCMLAVLAVEAAEEARDEPFGRILSERPAFVQWIALAALLVAFLFLGLYRGSYIASEFIYMQY